MRASTEKACKLSPVQEFGDTLEAIGPLDKVSD